MPKPTGFESAFPFASLEKYETKYCGECEKMEAAAVAKGRDPRKAICAACKTKRDLPEIRIGGRQ